MSFNNKGKKTTQLKGVLYVGKNKLYKYWTLHISQAKNFQT